MKKENPLQSKSFRFSLKIIDVYKELNFHEKEYVLSRQLLKSGTSIGANIAEAQHAESRKDFASKLSISLKEARESEYWIQLLQEAKYIRNEVSIGLLHDLSEIRALLIASIKTAKENS